MTHPHLDRAEQQILLILRRAQARGRPAIPLVELVRSALQANDRIDNVLAEAIDTLRAGGRIMQSSDGVSLAHSR